MHIKNTTLCIVDDCLLRVNTRGSLGIYSELRWLESLNLHHISCIYCHGEHSCTFLNQGKAAVNKWACFIKFLATIDLRDGMGTFSVMNPFPADAFRSLLQRWRGCRKRSRRTPGNRQAQVSGDAALRGAPGTVSRRAAAAAAAAASALLTLTPELSMGGPRSAPPAGKAVPGRTGLSSFSVNIIHSCIWYYESFVIWNNDMDGNSIYKNC